MALPDAKLAICESRFDEGTIPWSFSFSIRPYFFFHAPIGLGTRSGFDGLWGFEASSNVVISTMIIDRRIKEGVACIWLGVGVGCRVGCRQRGCSYSTPVVVGPHMIQCFSINEGHCE